MHEPTFFDELTLFLATRDPEDYIFAFTICFMVFCLVAGRLIANYRKKRHLRRRRAIIRTLLETAQGQNESFEMQLTDKGAGSFPMPALLTSIGDKALRLEALNYMPSQWHGKPIDVFFRVKLPEGQIFYKFRSLVLSLDARPQRSLVEIEPPTDVEVGQKRGFIRLKPTQEAVRVLGVWILKDDDPIPNDTGEIGKPFVSYTSSGTQRLVAIEDISGTGLALRIQQPVDAETFKTGTRLLCLLIYSESKSAGELVTFWCVGKVVNAREVQDKSQSLILGVEFTKWALLEKGKSTINWFQNSPTVGVGPISQWVMKMSLEQRKGL